MFNEITHNPDPDNVIAFHKSILDAIKTRDPNLVRRQLSQHFDHVKERINRYLETIDSKK
jgi:DNA-binding FadR family transcriptional regulator